MRACRAALRSEPAQRPASARWPITPLMDCRARSVRRAKCRSALWAPARQITNVAPGICAATDAVDVAQLEAVNTAVTAGQSHYFSVNDGGSQGTNYNNNGATGLNAIAIGVGSSASGRSALAIGAGDNVSGANSGAFGDPTVITGAGSYSLGNDNSIAANNAFVVGNGVMIAAGLDGAVALGNAAAVVAATPTASATIGGTLFNGFAGAAPAAGDVVSVGSASEQRQIQNVAAGQVSRRPAPMRSTAANSTRSRTRSARMSTRLAHRPRAR